MSGFDTDAYLDDVSADAPAGADLAYDADYQALFRLARGKPETQWSTAEEPDWRQVLDGCRALMTRTRDVPLTVLTAVALLQTHGLPGLADGLGLLQRQLDRHWPDIHPRPDPDNDDPTERVNAINALSARPGSFDTLYALGQRVRDLPLTDSPRLGSFSWNDLFAATGPTAPPAREDGTAAASSRQVVMAAFDQTPADRLREIAAAAARAADACQAIESLVTGHVGPAHGVDLSDLRQTLADVAAALDAWLATRHPANTVGDTDTGGVISPDIETAVTPQGVGTPLGLAIRSRADVTTAIDGICRYYAEHEPSSPVPLLLIRARRLVSLSFSEVIRDLAPDALGRLSILSGTDLESGYSGNED